MLQEGCAVRGIPACTKGDVRRLHKGNCRDLQGETVYTTNRAWHNSSYSRLPRATGHLPSFQKNSPREVLDLCKNKNTITVPNGCNTMAVVELRVPQCAQKVHVFLKKRAGEIINWPADAPCSQEQYNQRISEPLNPLITENIKTALINAGHITNADLVWTLWMINRSAT